MGLRTRTQRRVSTSSPKRRGARNWAQTSARGQPDFFGGVEYGDAAFAQEGVLGGLHPAQEIGEMDKAGGVRLVKLDGAALGEVVGFVGHGKLRGELFALVN